MPKFASAYRPFIISAQ